MIKALIVEDEIYIRKGLISMLKILNFNINILGACASIKEATIVAKSCKPDLIFLDINLQDGNSFEFLENTKELNFKVIFITAYKQYALQALKNGAVDYILKPVDIDELKEAINKVILDTENRKNNFKVVSEQILEDKKTRLILRLHEGFQVIDFKNLIYLKSDKGYTTFYMKNEKSYIASKPLKEFEGQLPSKKFVRVHQSYIINMDFIDRYDKTGYVHLNPGIKIPISVRKKENFLSRLFK